VLMRLTRPLGKCHSHVWWFPICTQCKGDVKREHGAAYPSGTKTVAAPATVSGEILRLIPLEGRATGTYFREGAQISMTREPGDLPPVVGAMVFLPVVVCANTGGVNMHTDSSNISIAGLSAQERVMTGIIAALLGTFMLYGVAFAHSDILHNAAHDTRHAITVPCH
jgi:cobalt transporter subunit CbtB